MEIIGLDLQKRESQLAIKARHLESLGHDVIVADPNDAPTYAIARGARRPTNAMRGR